MRQNYALAQNLAARIEQIPGVGEVYIPQDMNYPALRLNVDRVHAAELGLTQKDMVDNVITALNSNAMIAPNYWVDRRSGNDYLPDGPILRTWPAGDSQLRGSEKYSDPRARICRQPTTLDTVVKLEDIQTPTEIDHYQIQRVTDVYVTPAEKIWARSRIQVRDDYEGLKLPANVRVNLRGMVQGMNQSFKSFAIGFALIVRAAVPDPGGAVQVVYRSNLDHVGHSHGIHRCADHPAVDRTPR